MCTKNKEFCIKNDEFRSGVFDTAMGAASDGALHMTAGQSAVQEVQIAHLNQAPFVVGGFFAPADFAAGFATPP